MERLTALLCPLEDRMAKVVVSHHPFDLPPGMSESQVAGRAQIALGHLARCGADILLAGHLHVSHAGETTPRHPIPGPLPLVVQAGTATSTRERGEPNSFNVLRIAEGEVQVERLGFDAAHGVFAPAKRERFVRGKDGWEKG
jgi:hypothetical protein